MDAQRSLESVFKTSVKVLAVDRNVKNCFFRFFALKFPNRSFAMERINFVGVIDCRERIGQNSRTCDFNFISNSKSTFWVSVLLNNHSVVLTEISVND